MEGAWSKDLWRLAWREGYAPLLEEKSLGAVLRACRQGDPRLVQGATSVPPASLSEKAPCEAGCALVFARLALGPATAREAEDWFAGLVSKASARLARSAACAGDFTEWVDTVPRDEMLSALALECEAELAKRRKEVAA